MAAELQRQLVSNFLQRKEVEKPQIQDISSKVFSSRDFLIQRQEAIEQLPEKIKDIGRSIARNIASAGVSIARFITGESRKDVPLEQMTQFNIENAPPIMRSMLQSIFTKEPIKSIEQRIAEAEPKVKMWGETMVKSQNTIYRDLGSIAKNNPATLSFLGIMGSVGIDLTPFGGSSKNLFKEIVKTKTPGEAISLLSRVGVADDLARIFADDVVKVADEKSAQKLFNSIVNAQKSTKMILPEVQRVPEAVEQIQPFAILSDFPTKGGAIVQRFSTIEEAQKALPEIKKQFKSAYVFGEKPEEFGKLLREPSEIRDLEPLTKAGKAGISKEPPIKPPTELPTSEGGGDTINKLIKAIDEAVPLRAEQKKLYQEELAKRTARVAQAGAKVEGEAGFFAQLGELKGELPKKSFEAIRGQFNQQEIDSLFNIIEQTKTLLPLEKVGTKQGLTKLFQGIVPTPSEIEKLREVFPKELIDALLARQPLLTRIAKLGVELMNVPRTLMATTDLSFGFRQGVFMLGRPKQFFSAFKDQFKFFASEKAYQGLNEGIKARPTYLKMKQAGLSLTELGAPLAKREEVFVGQLAEKIPLYGRLVRASNRAYTGFANKLRADIFDDLLRKAEIKGIKIDDDFLTSLADFINSGTGRGKFGLKETGILPKSMEKAAPVMNAVFFSPRLMASRLNLLNPYFYIQMNPFVRKEALKTLFADASIFATIYGLWKLNGGEVGLDPRSADFGKLKIGNTRFDVLGGFQQYIKLASQLITGEIVSSATGRTITLGEGFKPLTRKEIVLRFFENKTSPIASFIIGLMTGQTAVGQDVDLPTEVVNRFIPMVVQDLYDISQEKGAEGLLYGLPAIFGVGLQTYGKQELAIGESRIGEPTLQIRPVPELGEKIRELILGQIPLGSSKSFSVESYFDQLQNLPREEAAEVFDFIAKNNPELAKKLNDVVKERELGITVKDKDLKAKGVASGDRALAVKKELDRLGTKEEKAVLWDDYVKKGIITTEVSRQLNILFSQ